MFSHSAKSTIAQVERQATSDKAPSAPHDSSEVARTLTQCCYPHPKKRAMLTFEQYLVRLFTQDEAMGEAMKPVESFIIQEVVHHVSFSGHHSNNSV